MAASLFFIWAKNQESNLMKAVVYLDEILVGKANLKLGDVSIGHIFGSFLPNDAYYKLLQPFVVAFAKTGNIVEWETLRINIQLENGCFIYAEGGITFTEETTNAIQIDIAGAERFILEDFTKNPPNPLMAIPWEPLSIAQKFFYEKELAKELAPNIWGFLNIFKTQKKHILKGSRCFAMGRCLYNDDVLFSVHYNSKVYNYAVVHLTYSSRNSKPAWPITKLYTDFDSFRQERMYKDKAAYDE